MNNKPTKEDITLMLLLLSDAIKSSKKEVRQKTIRLVIDALKDIKQILEREHYENPESFLTGSEKVTQQTK